MGESAGVGEIPTEVSGLGTVVELAAEVDGVAGGVDVAADVRAATPRVAATTTAATTTARSGGMRSIGERIFGSGGTRSRERLRPSRARPWPNGRADVVIAGGSALSQFCKGNGDATFACTPIGSEPLDVYDQDVAIGALVTEPQ